MRKLGLTALVFFGLSQTGCIIVTDDDEGQFRATWALIQNNAPVDCASVGAETVSVLSTDSFGTGFDDLFDCEDGQGLTSPLEPDTYVVVESILDAQGNPLGQSLEMTKSIIADTITPLDMVTFDFGSTGPFDISFSVDYGDAGGSNCNTGNPQDNGVVQQAITVAEQGGSTCLDFELTGIDQTNTPFTSDTCGSIAVCMENTVVQTINDMPPGSYTIYIEGKKTGTDANAYTCYYAVYEFDVTQDGDLGALAVAFNPQGTDAETHCMPGKPTR